MNLLDLRFASALYVLKLAWYASVTCDCSIRRPRAELAGLPMCSPMSQPSSLGSLLPEVAGMSPPMDYSDFLSGPSSSSPATQQQSNPFWATQTQPFPSSSNADWMRGFQSQNPVPSFPLDPYSFGGAGSFQESGVPRPDLQRTDFLGAEFPWVSSGQSWGGGDQQMDLQMDALLPEGPLQPTASSFMRRGFSAEALPRHFGVQQEEDFLQRPRSLGREPRFSRQNYAPAAFHSSFLNMPNPADIPASQYQTAAMEIESEPHPAFTQQGIQQGSQLRPRLEADYLVTKHTSVVALDQPSGRREPPSQASGLLDMPEIPTAAASSQGLGPRRLTYRVRSNALSELPRSSLQPRTSTARHPPTQAAPARESQEQGLLEAEAATGEGDSGGRQSTPTTGSGQGSGPATSEQELSGLQAGEGSRVMVDPQKLARFFQQLNTIQAKIARLQAERTANALREHNLRQAESVMEDALKELADMKSGGASMEDREAKLGNTEARLQTLLFNRAPVARDVPTDRPASPGAETQVPESEAMDQD